MCPPRRHTPFHSRSLRLTRRNLCQTLTVVEQADCAWCENACIPPWVYEIGRQGHRCGFVLLVDLGYSECSTDDALHLAALSCKYCPGNTVHL
jgi:hypothetical protein